MATRLDIFELFDAGRSGSLSLGHSVWESIQKLDSDLELIETEFKGKKVPGMAEARGYKVYLTYELRPVLSGLTVLFDYPAGVWGMAGPTDAKLSVPRVGRTKPRIAKHKWEDIQTLSGAFRHFDAKSFFCRSGSERQIFLVWIKEKRRLTLEYRLEAHALEANQFEFDYWLCNAGIEDLARSRLKPAQLKKYLFG